MRTCRIALVLAAVTWALPLRGDDSFLARPFEASNFDVTSIPETVEKLEQIIGKKITLPAGASDFAGKIYKEHSVGFISQGGMVGGLGEPVTNKVLLDNVTSTMGMAWRYDPASDTVVFDFHWHVDDPRPTAELAELLLHPLPASESDAAPVKKPGQVFALPENFTGPTMLDRLVSKPENMPSAWKVRLVEDLNRQLSDPKNLLSTLIKDTSGTTHIIVLHDEEAMGNPGQGLITYYVFSRAGKFEQGGAFRSGWRCHDVTASIEADDEHLDVEGAFNYSKKFVQRLVLTGKGLHLIEVLDGKEKAPSSEYSGYNFGKFPLHVPE